MSPGQTRLVYSSTRPPHSARVRHPQQVPAASRSCPQATGVTRIPWQRGFHSPSRNNHALVSNHTPTSSRHNHQGVEEVAARAGQRLVFERGALPVSDTFRASSITPPDACVQPDAHSISERDTGESDRPGLLLLARTFVILEAMSRQLACSGRSRTPIPRKAG